MESCVDREHRNSAQKDEVENLITCVILLYGLFFLHIVCLVYIFIFTRVCLIRVLELCLKNEEHSNPHANFYTLVIACATNSWIM